MAAGIILKEGTRVTLGDGVFASPERLSEIAAAALKGLGNGNYFLTEVRTEDQVVEVDKHVSEILTYGYFGLVAEVVRGDQYLTVSLSGSFPRATLEQLRKTGKIV